MFLAYINGVNQLSLIKNIEMVTVDDEGVIFITYKGGLLGKGKAFILKVDYKCYTLSED